MYHLGISGESSLAIGQERREPQLLKLTRVRVIADKYVDRLPPERPTYGPLLRSRTSNDLRGSLASAFSYRLADLHPELVGEAVLPGSGVAEDQA